MQFARWLKDQDLPAILGADANTPKIDAPRFADTRTHWHTGIPALGGEPGDDLLFGPAKIHRLDDALRRWLDEHPTELARVTEAHPAGPLAVSLRTGGNRGQRSYDRRYDAVWVSPEFGVRAVGYPYQQSLEAGSDHSAVVVDLEWTDGSGFGT